MRSLRPFGLFVVPGLVLLAAACGNAPAAPPAAPASAVDPATAARVSGRVRLAGAAPIDEPVRIDGDKACVSLAGTDQQAGETVLLGPDQGLANVFVYVRSGLEKATFPVPSEPVVIDQQKCRYTPRVVGVRVGQPVQIRNGDPLLHNVRADGEVNAPFNQGQPVQGMVYSHTFTTREVMVPIKCDVHAWMRAYIGALEHPFFAVTGPDGTFSLPDLPPGAYTVEAWHERLGTIEQAVTVGARESKDVALTFVAR